LAEASAGTIRRAAQVHPITALQSEYSLWSRDLEDTILPTCEELDIGVVAYSPLGRGFLTGAFKNPEDFEAGDSRRSSPRFSSENFAGNLRLVEVVSQIAREEGYTPAQVALAWLPTAHPTSCRFRGRATSSASGKMHCPSWCASAMRNSSGCTEFCANGR
jgi:aryl-alcohol dehydrogenase-like predicted oxidoreductase